MSRKNKKTNKTLKTLKAKRLKKAEGGNITPQQLTQGIKDLQEGKITPQQLQAMSSQLAKQTTAMQQGMNNPAPAENVLAPVETAPPVTTAPPPEETAAVKSENLYTTQADTAANTAITSEQLTQGIADLQAGRITAQQLQAMTGQIQGQNAAAAQNIEQAAQVKGAETGGRYIDAGPYGGRVWVPGTDGKGPPDKNGNNKNTPAITPVDARTASNAATAANTASGTL